MKIPQQIRIGGMDYTIEFVDEHLLLNDNPCCGTIDYDNCNIKISTKHGNSQRREVTFLHELLHGILRERNLALEDEERIVTELAIGLHQVIKDNREIFT